MTAPKVPTNCAWAFEDIIAILQDAQRNVGPLVLRPGDHMPSRSFLISSAAHTALCLNRAIQRIHEVHPPAKHKGGRKEQG